MMVVCNEMQQLRKFLDEKNIPWEDASDDMTRTKDFTVWICRTHFEYKGRKYSVANGFGTYGGWFGFNPGNTEKENMGLLELYDWQHDPHGWLMAEDVMKLIEKGEE